MVHTYSYISYIMYGGDYEIVSFVDSMACGIFWYSLCFINVWIFNVYRVVCRWLSHCCYQRFVKCCTPFQKPFLYECNISKDTRRRRKKRKKKKKKEAKNRIELCKYMVDTDTDIYICHCCLHSRRHLLFSFGWHSSHSIHVLFFSLFSPHN